MSNVSSSNGLEKYPKLRFKGFSEPFVVRKIGTFAKCYAGATPSTKDRSFWDNGTIPWLSSGEVNKKHIDFTDTYITQKGFENCSTKMVPSGTVVMALAGQGKTRGTVAITNIDLCTNQSLAAIVTDDSVCDLCLLYYLETQYENLRAVSSGDGTRGGLNLQIISDYPVCLPSIGEQIKIADFFAVLDKKIEKQHTLIETLKKYKRGVIYELFVNPDSQFDVEMAVIPMSQLLTEYRNRNTEGLRVCSVAVSKGVVDQIEHLGRSFAANDTSHYGRVKFGDVVYTKSPTGDFPFGIVKQSKLNEEVAVSPLYGVYTPASYATGNLIHAYFEQYQYANNYICTLAQKGAKNTINITNQRFLEKGIRFPVNERDREYFSAMLDMLTEKAIKAEKMLEYLLAQKRTLLAKMFI